VKSVQVKELCLAYDGFQVVKGVDFTVAPGEVLGLIGPNGAGKSTLIRALSGVLPIQSGEVWVDGTDLGTLSDSQRARLIAVVPQAEPLGGAYTVRQAVMMGRTPYMNWMGNPGPRDQAFVKRALEFASLADLAGRRIAELSGGEQQRVLLARALAQDTPILLLDEPTSHLDLQHQINLLSLVRRLAKENHLAVLLAMHDLNGVSLCADRVALLVDGRLVALGAPDEVLTAENIAAAYRAQVEIIAHPRYGTPLVLPLQD